ncbi:hypothetical protein [Psychromicrobium sp. YIM B11713]|uniref:hypothetical protein n=1 Tax=Psychromicrobium sp. YIM B11713 TaxID=3145233 RepID=UPI00374E4DDD
MQERVSRLVLTPSQAPATPREGAERLSWTTQSSDQAALVLQYILSQCLEQVGPDRLNNFVLDIADLLRSFGMHASVAELNQADLGPLALEFLESIPVELATLRSLFARSVSFILTSKDAPLKARYASRHPELSSGVLDALAGTTSAPEVDRSVAELG